MPERSLNSWPCSNIRNMSPNSSPACCWFPAWWGWVPDGAAWFPPSLLAPCQFEAGHRLPEPGDVLLGLIWLKPEAAAPAGWFEKSVPPWNRFHPVMKRNDLIIWLICCFKSMVDRCDHCWTVPNHTFAGQAYRKVPKFSDTKMFAVSYLKFKQSVQTLSYSVKMVQGE